MRILSTFTHFLQTYLNFFFLLNTKEDILKNVGITKYVMGSFDFHSRKKILWKSMGPTFLQLSSFVFNRRKTLIQVWNKLRVSK